MEKKKLWNFVIFVPFALAIGSFILYLRYYFELKSKTDIKVTELIETYLVRYKNIGIVCLAIGVLLLFIKTLIEYLRVDKEPAYIEETNALYRISRKQEENQNNKYTLSEDKIINDLLNEKNLKAVFVNTNNEKQIKFKEYDSRNSIIKFYDLDEPKVEKQVIEEKVADEYVTYDTTEFKKCKKCKSIIAKDSIICVHCGTVLKEQKTKTKKPFNPVIFAVNMIVILLCIILALLIINKINKQVEINKSNLNIQETQNK